jgi:hypothetical protein
MQTPSLDLAPNPTNITPLPVSFQPGYDSARSVDTMLIPNGGGSQTYSFSVTPWDPRFQGSTFHAAILGQLPGISVTSISAPSAAVQATRPNELAGWDIQNVQSGNGTAAGTAYSFSIGLHVPNP